MLSSFQSLIGQMCMCLSIARRWDQLPNNSGQSYGPGPRRGEATRPDLALLPACKPSSESNGPGSRAPPLCAFDPSLSPSCPVLPCYHTGVDQHYYTSFIMYTLLKHSCVTYIHLLVSRLPISHYMNGTMRNHISLT